MNWTAGDALAIVAGLAILALIGGWLDRWARRQDQDAEDDENCT